MRKALLPAILAVGLPASPTTAQVTANRVGDWTISRIGEAQGGAVCSALRTYGGGYALEVMQARGLPGQLILRLESPKITYRPGQKGEDVPGPDGTPYGLVIVINDISGSEGPDAIVRQGPRGLGFVTVLKESEDSKFSPIRNLRIGRSVYAYVGAIDEEVVSIGRYDLRGSSAALDALARCVDGEAVTSATPAAPLARSSVLPPASARGAIAVTFRGPSKVELAAVRRAFGRDRADELPVSVGHADLNGDGRPDLIFASENRDYCGALGCDTGAILATPSGYATRVINLAVSFDTMFVLPTMHNGMHDIRYGNARHVFVWDGEQYK